MKQQCENFSVTSAESLDSIFNRLQKIVSRLAILGVIIAQEDLNLNFLSSLPPEWNTHVVVWTNKPQIETISIDDLYNNFKIIEQKIKKTVGTSSGGQRLGLHVYTNSKHSTMTAKQLLSSNFDWSDMAEEQVQTNMALMAFSGLKEPKKVRKNNVAPIIEDWVSDDEEQDESMTKPKKKTVIPTAAKIEKPVKKLVRPRIVNTARSYRTPVNTVRPRVVNTARSNRKLRSTTCDKDLWTVECSRHMTCKGTLKTANLDFKDVYFVNELKFNLFSVSQINIVPKESLTCLVAKATLDESMLWHRRLVSSKFDDISDEGFFVGYSLSSKAFRDGTKALLKLYLIYRLEAMQEELLQFKLQQVWILVDLLNGK
ncbi:hypothetical protein Tco_0550551 [Tanacetum coccineum]